MRRVVVLLLSVFAIVGMLAPPVFAQAPAPKVTINGLVDFVTTAHRNWTGLDVTDGGTDRGWYSRERGVFTFTGEVGKAKGVLSLEFDFHQGQTNAPGGGAVAASGNSAGTDLDTDVPGFAEMKWLYVEVPFTGPGSLLPFIPAASILRGGAQPARGHDYKNGILLSGDIPAVTIETTWAPNLRSTVTYVQAREQLDEVKAPGAFESYALVASVELDVYKGFTIKPTFAYADFTGGSGQSSLGNPNTSGLNFNGTGSGVTTVTSNNRMWRSTLGGDIRWTAGPLSIQPTVYFQWGEQECNAAVVAGCTKKEVDIRTGIIDTIVGYRMGPLNIEFRGMFTPGNKANEVVANGDDINYFRGINPAFGYMAGWTDIQTSGVEYNQALLAGAPGVSLRTSPSYDKYGRIFLAGAADYALTPALTLTGLLNMSWTAEKVDTNGVLSASGLSSSTTSSGDSRYLGTEVNARMTYRFAPNVAFDLMGAYMFTGAAMDHARSTAAGHDREEADDVYKLTARVRFTF